MIAVELIVIDVDTLPERDAVEQRRHVLDRIDGHADASHFAGGQRVIGVVSHLRRQVERDAQAVDALRQQVSISLVGFGGRAKPAYCRIVQRRPRYIVGWMPRVKGNAPGSPRASSEDHPARSAGVLKSRPGPSDSGAWAHSNEGRGTKDEGRRNAVRVIVAVVSASPTECGCFVDKAGSHTQDGQHLSRHPAT